MNGPIFTLKMAIFSLQVRLQFSKTLIKAQVLASKAYSFNELFIHQKLACEV
jgi:hypothetical protein